MIKILIMTSVLYLLPLNSYADELKDCSEYSKLNPKYLACKATNLAKNTIKYQNEQWSDSKKDKTNIKD
tara:strand:- start:2598 stop:2804 length:207 start_codon:yes stop_codon:yes gene_type:complete